MIHKYYFKGKNRIAGYNSDHVALFLDFDGTLTHIIKDH